MSTFRSHFSNALAFLLSAYALYWVITIVDPYAYRFTFLLITLVLTFLGSGSGADSNEADGSKRTRPTLLDFGWIALAIVALAWPLSDVEGFILRAATPTTTDLVLGA